LPSPIPGDIDTRLEREAEPVSERCSTCPCGGTGRRARLKIVFRKEWGFDSLHGHHS
jgi:hypothetical protein